MFSTSLGKLQKKSPGKVVDFLSNPHQKSENGWTQAGFRKRQDNQLVCLVYDKRKVEDKRR